jgi:hypothetical protein
LHTGGIASLEFQKNLAQSGFPFDVAGTDESRIAHLGIDNILIGFKALFQRPVGIGGNFALPVHVLLDLLQRSGRTVHQAERLIEVAVSSCHGRFLYQDAITRAPMGSIGAAGSPIQDPAVVVTKVPDYRKTVSASANSMTILPSGQLFLPASRFKSLPEIGDAND